MRVNMRSIFFTKSRYKKDTATNTALEMKMFYAFVGLVYLVLGIAYLLHWWGML